MHHNKINSWFCRAKQYFGLCQNVIEEDADVAVESTTRVEYETQK